MKRFLYFSIAAFFLLVSCQQEKMPDDVTVISVDAGATKTSLGTLAANKRPVYWCNGDRMALNGTASDALEGLAAGATQASFKFHGSFSSPYNLVYPASLYKDATTITLPAAQTWASGAVVAVPMAASPASASGDVALSHLCAIVQLRVKKSASVSAANLVSVSFKGNAGEQVCGDFTIDYANATLTPAGDGDELSVSVNQALSESEDLDIYLVVPAQTYSAGFTVELEDALHRTMQTAVTRSFPLSNGQLARGKAFSFEPSEFCSELAFETDVTEDIIAPEGYNVKGRVVDTVSGKGLEGVVVSDGLQSVRTLVDGSFYMVSDLSKTKFVWVSTPSGYLPPVTGGIPQFFKKKADITPSAGIYDFGTYSLTPDGSTDPDHFTIFITADPQPRGNWVIDHTAYRSLQCCNNLYTELQETAAPILAGGQQVYGICLGDIVHEDMSLFSDYKTGLATLGYPTYNVIGNHDNDPSGSDDDAGGAPFESHFGPRNYSFNIGGIHFVVLDNLMMFVQSGKLTGYTQGLTDDIWAWLQSDLAFVPTSSTLMACAHSALFKQDSGSERSNTAQHGPDYGDLINNYAEVHAWAGHSHRTFNYNYPSDHRHKRIQVHTLARSTGELWTNEYLSEGTPRGFTIVDVNHGVVSWKFHPTKYQPTDFRGDNALTTTGGTSYPAYAAPSYTYRDWNYSSGTAVMKAGGGPLTEDYQMHVYKPGLYEAGYAYANIFLWDDKWGTPTFSLDGGAAEEMTHLNGFDGGDANCYDYANWEIANYYTTTANAKKRVGSSYKVSTSGLHSIFKVPCTAEHGTGTVTVTDRFGNTYTGNVTW